MCGRGGARSLICRLWIPADLQFYSGFPGQAGYASGDQPFPAYSWDQKMSNTLSKNQTNTAKQLGTPFKIPEGQGHPSTSSTGKPGPKKTGNVAQSVHPISQSGQSMSGVWGKPGTGVAAKQSVTAAGKCPGTGEPLSTPAGGVSASQCEKPSYQDKRCAAFILSKEEPEYKSSAEGTAQRAWATSILPDFQPAKAGKLAAKANKRKSSAEDPATQPGQAQQAKRVKTQITNRSFAEVAKGKTLIGVLDRGAKDGNVPRDKWHRVENELQDRFLQELGDNGGSPPKCEDAGWHQGTVKAIACQDASSAALYMKAVAALNEVYPGAKLEAVRWEDIPSRPRARAWVSVRPAEPERILRILQVCNPHLPTDDWKVAKVEDVTAQRRQIILVLNEESLELISQTDGVVDYGYKKVAITPYKSDSKGRQAEVKPDPELLVVPKEEAPSADVKPVASDVASVNNYK